MPISYRSVIHKPIDYTAPVDLNLLGKVLQYQQAKYDAGVQKTQGYIDNLASMDVVKQSDRDYLNTRINNLVSSINGMGGIDFSDANTANAVAGMSSQVYGDDKIIGAIANTKKFRYVQKFYQDLKEKKPKDYNPANEDYDMSKFENWLSDGQVGTNPDAGAGQVTPFVDYRTNHMKLFEKIAGNMTTQWTDKGLMFRKDEKTFYTPQEVMSAAAKLLSPAERQQMAIDGRYQYKGVDDMHLAEVYDKSVYNNAKALQDKLDTYKTRLLGSVSVKDKEDYERLIALTEADLKKTLAPISKNANQIRENLYTQQYFQGLAERYAFSRVKSTMQANTGEMFRQNMNFKEKEFEYRQKNDQLDRDVEMAKNDLIWYTDPIYGTRTIIKDPNAPKRKGTNDNGSFIGDGLPMVGNSGEDSKYEFSKNTLDNRKTDLVKSNEQLITKYKDYITRMYGIPTSVVSDYMDDGHLTTKEDPKIVAILKDKFDAWKAMTEGKTINFKMLDKSFKDMMMQYQENQKEIEGIDKYYQTIENSLKDEFGYKNDVDWAKAKKYADLQQQLADLANGKHESSSTNAGSFYSLNTSGGTAQEYHNKVAAIQNQINALGFNPTQAQQAMNYFNLRNSRRDALISSASQRFNLPTATVTDNKDKDIAKMISGNATTLQWYNADGSTGKKLPLNIANITPSQVGFRTIKTANGWVRQPVVVFQYKTGSKPEDFEERLVPITPQQQKALGVDNLKDLTGYRLALHLNGEINNVFTVSGKNYDLKYDVVKIDPNDANSDEVAIRIWKGNNAYVLNQDNLNRNFNSLEDAQTYMETLTKFKSIDEVYDNLAKLTGESK